MEGFDIFKCDMLLYILSVSPRFGSIVEMSTCRELQLCKQKQNKPQLLKKENNAENGVEGLADFAGKIFLELSPGGYNDV